jgi:tetratricopeptide (TPR) repeat protein
VIYLGKKSILELINKGMLDDALIEVNNKKSGFESQDNINQALIKRYQGKINEAIEILEKNYLEKESLDVKTNIKNSLLLLYFYYLEKRPIQQINDVKSFISFQIEEIGNLKELGNFWLGIWECINGKGIETKNVYDAILLYLEAIKHFEKQDNNYELMHGYFLVGSTYRVYGDYIKAREYLEKSLKIASRLDKSKNAQYLTYTSEILFLRSKNNYKIALEYLRNSLPIWESLNLTFGVAWSVHDLGVVYHLSGDLEKAFEFLNLAHSFITDQVNIQYKVRSLLSLIEILVELKNELQTKIYFKELSTIIGDNILYEDELHLAEAIILRSSQRLADKLLSSKIFEKLNSNNQLSYELKLKSLINHLDLTLLELKFVQSDEAVTIAKGLAKQILDYSDKSYNLLVHTTILIDKLTNLIENKKQEEPFNATTIKGLSPLLHSIPRLTIILYVLPRKGVTFSDLEIGTGLTQGNIANHTTKLISEGFMISEKMFINAKLVTVYKMTEKGIEKFEQYVKTLTGVLQGFFSDK